MADEFGVIVLAPDSREWTWDAILGRWGPDVEFLQLAMKQTLGRYTIDRQRLWLGGFSDGGSYSLSLGISYGDVFRKVFAGAPGVMQPIEANGKPPIFLAHGRQDPTMPIDETSRKFLPRLKALELRRHLPRVRRTSHASARNSPRSVRMVGEMTRETLV